MLLLVYSETKPNALYWANQRVGQTKRHIYRDGFTLVAVKYDECVRLAGELFGRLLARDSDKEGYDYILEQLSTGQRTLSELVREMATSDEFRERHVMNQSPNELARRLIVNFMGFTRADPLRIKALAIRLLVEDWRVVVSDVVSGPEYKRVHGDRAVPRWN